MKLNKEASLEVDKTRKGGVRMILEIAVAVVVALIIAIVIIFLGYVVPVEIVLFWFSH